LLVLLLVLLPVVLLALWLAITIVLISHYADGQHLCGRGGVVPPSLQSYNTSDN
jgi:hypothetical protein